MAALDTLQNLSNQVISTTQQAQQAQKEGISRIKQEQGYEDRLKTLENLRRATYDTEKTLSQLPSDIQNRTRGRLITAAQQNRVTSKEREPLAATLANLSRSQDVEQQGVGMVRSLLDDFLKESMSDTDAKLKALGLQREDARTSLQLEQSERDKAFQREMANLSAANQRTLASMNQPNYDLSFLTSIIDKQRQAKQPTVKQPNIEGARNALSALNTKFGSNPLLSSIGKLFKLR